MINLARPLIYSVLATTIIRASPPAILVNQVAYDLEGPKFAVVRSDAPFAAGTKVTVVELGSGNTTLSTSVGAPVPIEEWAPGKSFYQINFSDLRREGRYRLEVASQEGSAKSLPFIVEKDALAKETMGAILHYYHQQRATTPAELEADSHVLLYGSAKRVDLHGGWCDASGDVSKYFSHLAYANVMSPQQTPMVVWSMASAHDEIPWKLRQWKLTEPLEDEALYGADYLRRSLSDEGYFYMIIFSYFNKDPSARRVVGLHANSVTTDEYQCAFREGGGMAIAALARVSQWKRHGDYTSAQYLEGAKRAFAHLLANNTRYDDDGKENIIDDYCALLAATELWIATDGSEYRDQSRLRANRLVNRLSPQGYFVTDESGRPFWHAADAGLPIVALCRYLDKETEPFRRSRVKEAIGRALDYEMKITNKVNNPFGYARQTFRYGGSIRDGFFIPHDNETGWWWQGEDARLGSLATAALAGGRIARKGETPWGVQPSLADFASRQISWILGCNPYSICLMYGFGASNVPHMSSNFGHGSERGGISNGITGREGAGDGSGIDFKTTDQGNEWRWTEQWIPHAAWFLQAISAMADEPSS